jgi:D-glycero-beta-D-manno-heptose-7-phosphate kinase
LSGFEIKRLRSLFDNFGGKRIAVLGDLMLDKYIWGSVSRISPEAPVPVLEIESESARLGGAANVANNIKSLGAQPILFGIIGDDDAGERISHILDEMSLTKEGIIKVAERPTTVKTRVIAHGQHVVRLDQEVKKDVDEKIVAHIMEILQSLRNEVDAIILEDYNKGMLTKNLLAEVITFANKNDKVVGVDPKQNNFFEYKHVTIFKPNRKEAEIALRTPIATDDESLAASRELSRLLDCENVLLTRGEKGMTLLAKGGSYTHLPTKARKVADVSGAGDTVISTFTVAIVSGATVTEAAAIANHAGGIVCGEVGIAPVDKERLFTEVTNDQKSIPESVEAREF